MWLVLSGRFWIYLARRLLSENIVRRIVPAERRSPRQPNVMAEHDRRAIQRFLAA
jgi:hypothetical protein